MGTAAGYAFFGACALGWAAIAHTRGLAMRAQARVAPEMFWYAGGGLPLAVATIFLAQSGDLSMWQQRILLAVIGAVIGGAALVGVGELAHPTSAKAQTPRLAVPANDSPPPVTITGGDNVVSIGQIGGITARTVTINPPNVPELQILSRDETDNPDGSHTVHIKTQVVSPITPGLLLIKISAHQILNVSIMSPPVDGASTMMMRNGRSSPNAYSAEIPAPRGQYDIAVRTASRTDVRLDASFNRAFPRL